MEIAFLVLNKCIFANRKMVVVVQLVRTPDCGSGGRRFKSGLPPKKRRSCLARPFFYVLKFDQIYLNNNFKTLKIKTLKIDPTLLTCIAKR